MRRQWAPFTAAVCALFKIITSKLLPSIFSNQLQFHFLIQTLLLSILRFLMNYLLIHELRATKKINRSTETREERKISMLQFYPKHVNILLAVLPKLTYYSYPNYPKLASRKCQTRVEIGRSKENKISITIIGNEYSIWLIKPKAIQTNASLNNPRKELYRNDEIEKKLARLTVKHTLGKIWCYDIPAMIYQTNRLDCLSTDWLKQGKITAVRNKVNHLHYLVYPVQTVLNVAGRGLVTGWTQLEPP